MDETTFAERIDAIIKEIAPKGYDGGAELLARVLLYFVIRLPDDATELVDYAVRRALRQ